MFSPGTPFAHPESGPWSQTHRVQRVQRCCTIFLLAIVSTFNFTAGMAAARGPEPMTRIVWQHREKKTLMWGERAKAGSGQREMIVVERQAAATTAVRITLRLDRAADVESFERTICVAASICESLYRQHAYVECLIDQTLYVCGASETEFRKLMDAFARIRQGEVIAEPTCSSAHRSSGLLEIVVTTEGCLTELPRTASQRMVVVQSNGDNGRSHVCPWLTVSVEADWSRQLPQLWRKACHAA